MSAKRLTVVTHVQHHRHNGQLWAYGPYVREMEIWRDLFAEVIIAAPCTTGPPPADALAFSARSAKLDMHAVRATGGHTLTAKLNQAVMLPWIVIRLLRAIYMADVLHVRCPGNLGLLGILLGPLGCRRRIAKYAGQWSGYEGEPITVRWQRRLLASQWWKGIVTVYGHWPDQPPHVVPFFTSVMTEAQVQTARQIAANAKPTSPLSVLFVGRLSKAKNVDVLIEAVAELKSRGIAIRCQVVGQGAEQASLQRRIDHHDLQACVQLIGAVPYDRVFEYYRTAHVLVLASQTEGWPKVIAEAMACGLVCVGSDRGLVPWMLAEGRGYTVTPGDVGQLAEVLMQTAADPAGRQEIARRAAEFGQQYSLESLRKALAELMSRRWGLSWDLPVTDATPESSHGVVSGTGQDSPSRALTDAVTNR